MSQPNRYFELGPARREVLKNNPALLDAIVSGGQFGGGFSTAIANHMYSRTNAAAIADARDGMSVEQHGDRSYLIRFPFVNVAAFDTDDGLVLVDAGFAPAGPALLEACTSISSKPVHTIILSHFHCDHAFGAWALFKAGHRPEIVATTEFAQELQADLDTWGLNSRYTNQNPNDVPHDWDIAFTPTVTYSGSMSLDIGGVRFDLTHGRGETADQQWVWVPGERAIVSADYYQPFLPNAGNGKRRQRHIRDWAAALRAMADCQPLVSLPMHGAALGELESQDRFRAHADILDSIVGQVLTGLNAGTRGSDIVETVVMPAEHAGRDDVAETYSTVRDIAKMVVNQYTGWWDDIPSHWAPASVEAEAVEIARLAGGADRLMDRALELIDSDVRLACQLADWAYFAQPGSERIRSDASRVYIARIISDETPTQEALVYLDHLAELELGS
ncbi:MAG: MBL fold metallo-hydrolase [Acidimicrobiaceae bacterium]|jgi:alkyl sulfatase BDS1-like metallo-beta-lactamase superfamily hydrolase|nr:MBL fold metallo-hydrolase [Acidimicrobiaceae bacterium]MBT5578834.1 MBL fold metallo-hydrolase [Acidimicrobiaceae bacterium]